MIQKHHCGSEQTSRRGVSIRQRRERFHLRDLLSTLPLRATFVEEKAMKLSQMINCAARWMLCVQSYITCSQAQGRLLQSPETQVVLPGANATFNCNVSKWGWWYIDGKHNETNWSSRDIISNYVEVNEADPSDTTTAMTLWAKGIPVNNGSQIQCLAYDDTANTAISAPAYLIIAGPPLPPHIDLILLNGTLLEVVWNKPFTWTDVADITSYTVSMYNSSSQEWKNWTVGPLVSNITLVKADGSAQCIELSFYVSATNVIGTSSSGNVSGGFPIAIEWSPGQNSTARVNPSVQYNIGGTVVVTVQVQPPRMCSYQFATYDVSVCDFKDGTKLKEASVIHQYGNGDPIDILVPLQLSIKKQSLFYAILVVRSSNFTSLQAIAVFNIFTTNLISAAELSTRSNAPLLIGAITGSITGLLAIILFTIIISFVVVFRLQKAAKFKAETIRRQAQSIFISEPVVPPHLQLLEPVYEHISDYIYHQSSREDNKQEATPFEAVHFAINNQQITTPESPTCACVAPITEVVYINTAPSHEISKENDFTEC